MVARLVQPVGMTDDGRAGFFISYAGPDRPWAEWVAWQLKQAGYGVELDVWDWLPGDNAVLRMNDALARGDRMLMLWSRAYFERKRFTNDEWTALMAERPDPDGRRRLVPVRVEDFDPLQIPHILRPLIYRDLFGMSEERTRAELLAAVDPRRPREEPPFPGEAGPGAGRRVPGSLPPVQRLPDRNLAFTGRQAELAKLRQALTGGKRAWVQALNGIGGVGKTQLAVEYAYLFAGDYQCAWWVNAERAELIGEQLAELAVAARWVAEGTITDDALETLRTRLSQTPGWLIVFDNAESPAGVRDWLPQGPGHVIITSRSPGYHEFAAPLKVDTFSRGESVEFLRRAVEDLTEADADAIADELGDLPLALAQAAGLMAETAMTVAEYREELYAHANRLLSRVPPASHTAPLAAVIALSTERLTERDPAAVELLRICAVLAPEPIPLQWFQAASHALPDRLRNVLSDVQAWRDTLGDVARLGLGRITGAAIQLHRLTQAVLRDQRSQDELRIDRGHAEKLVAAAEPGDGSDPGSWPAWDALLPHLLALDPATAGGALRWTACNAVWYLVSRGADRTAQEYAQAWHREWRTAHGPDDQHTLRIASDLGTAYSHLGNYQQAHQLHAEVLDRYRRIRGADDIDTLSACNNLGNDLMALGELGQARELLADTYDRFRRNLGPDHMRTLKTAISLANVLRRFGYPERSWKIDRDTLDRRRRASGWDHRDTLGAAINLVADLVELGDLQEARDLVRDTLDRGRRALGPDHPYTRMAAARLAEIRTKLGERPQGGSAPTDDAHAQVVNRLLAIPGMVDRDLRQQVYRRLPAAVREQLPHHAIARVELVGLVTTLTEYQHLKPWEELVAEIEAVVPNHPSVTALVDTLREAGFIEG